MATWPTVTNDDGSGTVGTILDQTLFNSIRDYVGDAWTAVAYAGGNFSASGAMTWGVDLADQATFAYTVRGKTMTISWWITASDVGGTASTSLLITIPGGATSQRAIRATHWYQDAGTEGIGLAYCASGGNTIQLFKANSGSNWTLTTGDNTSTAGQITIEIA